MSFDFHLLLPAERLDTAEQRIQRLEGTETHRTRDCIAIAFSGTDRQMAAAYAALVELASSGGGRLHNLQSGGDVGLASPGRLPDGWVETPIVVGRAYTSVLEGVVAQLLTPQGFAWRDKATLTRRSNDLEQGVYLQQLTGRSAGRVRLHGYWTPLHNGPDTETGTAMASVFYKTELRCDKPAMAAFPNALSHALKVSTLPWMTRFRSLSELVAGYEGGALTAPQAFGTRLVDEMASCYLTIGERARGVEQLRALPGRLTQHRPERDDGHFDEFLLDVGRQAEAAILSRLQ